MKFGLKLWASNPYFDIKVTELIKTDYYQYIELLPIPGNDKYEFLQYNIEFIIHVPHDAYGLDISDSKKERLNDALINNAIDFADTLDSKYIVLHPGSIPIENSLKYLDKLNDDRILIENLPLKSVYNQDLSGCTWEQVKQLQMNRFGFCFDIPHAIKASLSFGEKYKSNLKKYIKLNPNIIHISDTTLANEVDYHLDIGCGELDFKYISKLIRDSKSEYITLEVPSSSSSESTGDINNNIEMRKLLK